jgi:hypothetical protein
VHSVIEDPLFTSTVPLSVSIKIIALSCPLNGCRQRTAALIEQPISQRLLWMWGHTG